MAEFLRETHKTVWIPASKLNVVWAESQRGFDEKKAQYYADHMDPDAFGTIVVTLPNDEGVYHVIDGQHRVAGVRIIWGDDEKLPCNVVNAKDPKRAAELFTKINTARSAPNHIEAFHVAVTAGHEAECTVNKLLVQLGYRVSNERNDGVIRAIGAVMNVYKSHGLNVLRDSLLILGATWGKQQDATDRALIRGYAHILSENPHIDKQRLVDTVGAQYRPSQLVASAKGAREMFHGSLAENIGRIVASAYNRNLKKEKRIGE